MSGLRTGDFAHVDASDHVRELSGYLVLVRIAVAEHWQDNVFAPAPCRYVAEERLPKGGLPRNVVR